MKETQVSILIAYIASYSLFKHSKHDNKRIVLSPMNDVSNYLSLNGEYCCCYYRGRNTCTPEILPYMGKLGPLCPFSSQDLWEGSEDAYLTDQRTDKENTSGQGHCILISFSLFLALLPSGLCMVSRCRQSYPLVSNLSSFSDSMSPDK